MSIEEENNISFKSIIENLGDEKYLNLGEKNIGEDDAKFLAEALKTIKITRLDINDNPLRELGTKYLAENIKYSHIRSLNLSSVCMGDEGVKYLAQGLKDSPVRELDLENNQISDDGVKSLAQVLEYTQITELYLDRNHMGIEGADYINEILDKTKIISLFMQIHLTKNYDTQYISYSMNHRSDEIGINIFFNSLEIGADVAKFMNKMLRNIPILRLGLAPETLEADDAKNLAEAFKNVKIMKLCCIPIIDTDCIEYLIHAFSDSEISELNFSHYRQEPIGAMGAKNLAVFLGKIKVIRLNLSEHWIGDDGLKHLATSLRNNTISSLDLTSNEISDHGIKYLAEVLKDSSITELNLNHNHIGAEGSKCLAEGLKFSPLIRLDLESNAIEDEGAQYIIQALKDTQIAHLNLKNNSLSDKYGKYLAENLKYSQIVSLNLCCVGMGDECVKYIAQGLRESQVESLDLSWNEISDDGVRCLAQVLEYTQITDLKLDTNWGKCLDAFRYINEVLDRTKISNLTMDIGCYIMAYHDEKDIHITFYSNEIEIDTAKFINETFQNIPIFQLEFAAISDIDANIAECLTEAFKNVDIMKFIFVPNSSVHNSQYLIQIFRNSKIARLDIIGHRIKLTDLENLMDFLEEMKIIDLSYCRRDAGDAIIQHLIPLLKNGTIMSLELVDLCITDHGIKFLAEVLKDSHITKLDLSQNRIGDKGAKYLADGLKFSQVRSINLSENFIQDAGYQYLKSIISDTFVTEINLEGNFIHELRSSNKPYIISRNTCLTLADEIILAFESVVTFNLLNNEFEFSINKNQSYPPKSIDQYVFLIKTLNHDPILKVQIFDKICRKKTDYFDFVIMDRINEFVESLSERFNTFFNSELLSLMELSPDYDYVNLVRQFEDSKLYDIVKNLLSHRTLYYVDENDTILHPYIYEMLYKYDMTLYNGKLEPCKGEKIISYYQNYLEINDVQKFIDLLRSVSLEHKQ